MITSNVVVYVGSTYRDEAERGQEHFNICGGSPRVAITFAQKQFQPRNQSFRIDVAWSGMCTRQQARGIEQYFIEKHNTRVYPRPTNGVTRDIDLISGAPPLQLNVQNASTDRAMVEYAETRVKRDSAVVSTDAFEQLRVRQRLELVALELDMEAQRTSICVIERILAKYGAMPITQEVSVTQFQGDLNEVLASNSDENKELRSSLSCLLSYFNADHRGVGFTLRAGTAVGHFETMLWIVRPYNATKEGLGVDQCASCRKDGGLTFDGSSSGVASVSHGGPPQRIIVASPSDFTSIDDAFDSIVASVVAQLVPEIGKIVTLKDITDRMELCSNPVVWHALCNGEPNSTKFKQKIVSKIGSGSVCIERLQGKAADIRGRGASGYHVFNYTLCPMERGEDEPPATRQRVD
jgi:hypothetical protein